MKKLLFLFLWLPAIASAAVFSDAELSANLQVPYGAQTSLTCGHDMFRSYANGTDFTSNAEFGHWGGAWQFPLYDPDFAYNVRVGFSATTNLSNFTLANGSVVRKSTGSAAISILRGINIYEGSVLKVHLPIINMWGTAASNYRLSNGQIQAYSASTGITGVTARFTGYYYNGAENGVTRDWYSSGYLTITKDGKNYNLTCYDDLWN